MKAKLYITSLICGLACLQAHAQDFHLAQYDAFPLYLNPSLTGNYLGEQGDYRVSSVYRTQWKALTPKPYTTYGIAYDMPYKRFGVGGYLLDNKSGVGNFNTLDFQLSGSYFITDPKTSPHLLSTGIQLGLFYKSYNPQKYLFESQYDYSSGTLNQDIASGENLNRMNRTNFDANMGIFYKYRDKQKKYWPFIGVALYHVNRPTENFYAYKSRLPIRFNIQGGCDFQVNEKLKLTPQILYMTQAKAWECNIGALAYYRLNDSKESDVHYDLIGGLNYRVKDACIVQLGVKKDNLAVRMSYDFNTSYLNSYTGGRGGFEITLQVIGIKGRPVFKTMAKF
ncbi:MAG: PorP/SprF family type IX secretion system membrane protein [Bacteroidetes bacterium]|nr:PorP/SprF family type IX secretion system membrane protein [Bacteroidota bacterium]